MGALAQILGVTLASVGGWLLWSPWAFVIGAAVLLIAPELGELRRR
jgi:hypothetical protein